MRELGVLAQLLELAPHLDIQMYYIYCADYFHCMMHNVNFAASQSQAVKISEVRHNIIGCKIRTVHFSSMQSGLLFLLQRLKQPVLKMHLLFCTYKIKSDQPGYCKVCGKAPFSSRTSGGKRDTAFYHWCARGHNRVGLI